MLSVTEFRKFLESNPPPGSRAWDTQALGKILDLDKANLSRWLHGNFKLSQASLRKFDSGLTRYVTKLKEHVHAISDSEDPEGGGLGHAQAQYQEWSRWKTKWDGFLRAPKADATSGRHSTDPLQHGWMPADNVLNALICSAFISRHSCDLLKVLVNERPQQAILSMAPAQDVVQRLMKILVTALQGYVVPKARKNKRSQPMDTVLRAMCHLVGPRLPDDPENDFRLCHIAEFCPLHHYDGHAEDESIATLLALNSTDRVLSKAIKTGKFCEGDNAHSYKKDRKWRAIHVFAAPIPVAHDTGPAGLRAGVVTLDVFCRVNDWAGDANQIAIAAVSNMQIRSDEMRDKVRNVMMDVAHICGELLMSRTISDSLSIEAQRFDI